MLLEKLEACTFPSMTRAQTQERLDQFKTALIEEDKKTVTEQRKIAFCLYHREDLIESFIDFYKDCAEEQIEDDEGLPLLIDLNTLLRMIEKIYPVPRDDARKILEKRKIREYLAVKSACQPEYFEAFRLLLTKEPKVSLDCSHQAYNSVPLIGVAIRGHNIAAVELLFQKGANTKFKDHEERNLLEQAAAFCHKESFDFLIGKGFSLSQSRCLISACQEWRGNPLEMGGLLEMVDYLLDQGVDPQESKDRFHIDPTAIWNDADNRARVRLQRAHSVERKTRRKR
jgi:hypothetical protein